MKEETKAIQAGVMTGVAIAVILIAVGLFAIFATGTESKYSTYKKEAVTILEKYKDGKYDEDEAQERLNDIRLDAMSAGIESSSEVDKEKYEFLQSEINAIVRSLKKGAVRDTDVDTTIRHIKNGR